jgi:hypothetical protein
VARRQRARAPDLGGSGRRSGRQKRAPVAESRTTSTRPSSVELCSRLGSDRPHPNLSPLENTLVGGGDARSQNVDRGVPNLMGGLKIAMIGQRGVPATFGGIEHHVEELGSRLVDRGHEVTVFCRPNYVSNGRRDYRGMRLQHVPTVGTKHFDAIAHSATSTVAAMRDSYDVIHYHALGPGLLAFAPRLASRAKVVLTVHGLDHERAKWGLVARSVLKTAGWLSARVPDATITVSRSLTDYYANHHRRRAVYIPNGVAAPQNSFEDLEPPFRLSAG